ncbi:hypothetical protein HCC61_06500 [Streptomyces sp. HNM0575]|uniref:hypothetical protein n=1 Tax=Streptomyces sp. HNM0575 TaxID=2716338 RepID=UPI00145E307F|nr:hypothetical protein [Streptomyces sp. HNM0575]NLU72333.1 hypothetical protein [Streptomyces sp. HNM0575]
MRPPGAAAPGGEGTGGAEESGHAADRDPAAGRDRFRDGEGRPGGGADGGRPRGGGGGAVHIGTMTGGAIATGAQGQATSYSGAVPPGADEATLALLEAVRALRADMRVLAATEETAAVDGELGEIEGEITRTGRAGEGRLARLRDRLEAGASAVGLLASSAAVVQAVAQVLG